MHKNFEYLRAIFSTSSIVEVTSVVYVYEAFLTYVCRHGLAGSTFMWGPSKIKKKGRKKKEVEKKVVPSCVCACAQSEEREREKNRDVAIV